MAYIKNEDYSEQDLIVARFMKAMSHPARIVILQYLSPLNECSCCFNELSKILPISKSTISQHLKVLKDAGLILGRIEPPYMQYCINRENWAIVKKLFFAIAKIKQ